VNMFRTSLIVWLGKWWTLIPRCQIDVNIAAKATSAYPQLSAEEILRSDPEIIVLAAADYSAKPDQVAARAGWSALSAVKNKRIVTIAPNLINRPGPRVGEAAEAYAKLVHPELFR